MPAAVATPLKGTILTQDVINGNASLAVPADVHAEYCAPILKEIFKFTDPSTLEFDASKHLLWDDSYYEKTKRYTLEELGRTEVLTQEPISDIGVSEPFPLFTEEAVAMMRYEMFKKDSFENCARFSTDSNTGDKDMYMRGYMEYAPFTRAAWTHPKTMEIISKMCGVELLHQFEKYEISHTNISIKQRDTKIIEAKETSEENPEDIAGIVSWHFDSPQFGCILMMSDTTNMVGGETALMKGDGSVIRVEGPKQGWAYILQGRVLKHIATKPKGDFTERITSVCAYRPADPMIDECALTTVKPSVLAGSRYNEFYKEYMDYRIDVLEKRLAILKAKINSDYEEGIDFNQMEVIDFLKTKVNEYCDRTWQEFEVVDEGLVEKPATYNVKQARWM